MQNKQDNIGEPEKVENSRQGVTLTNASHGPLQDAWHYAKLITSRHESTFDGDREFPEGIRGQVRAYERLLSKIDHMTANNETWELVRSGWWTPDTYEQMVANAFEALAAVNSAAEILGIDARTGEKRN